MDESLGDSVKPATSWSAATFGPRWAFVSSGIALKAPDPTVVTESGSSTSVSSVPEKACLPTETRPSLRPRWVSRAVMKALSPMVRTEAGRSSEAKRVPTKALAPMVVRAEGSPALVEPSAWRMRSSPSEVFSEKAAAPISVTASPMVTSLSWELRSARSAGTAVSESGRDRRLIVEFENAPSPSLTTFDGRRTSSRL